MTKLSRVVLTEILSKPSIHKEDIMDIKEQTPLRPRLLRPRPTLLRSRLRRPRPRKEMMAREKLGLKKFKLDGSYNQIFER